MKHKVRDEMLAIISDACEALPGANDLVLGSQTRAATALKGLLANAIFEAHGQNRTGVDPVALARQTIAHKGFASAIDQMPAVFAEATKSNKETFNVAGFTIIKAWGSIGVYGEYGKLAISYAEDTLTRSKTVKPCADRIEDILHIFRAQFARHVPTIDTSLVRHEINEKGVDLIVYPGWNKQCMPEDIRYDVTSVMFAHEPISEIMDQISFAVDDQKRRCKKARDVGRQANEIGEVITAALDRLASDIPLDFHGIEVTDKDEEFQTDIIFQGTTFNFGIGDIRSNMKKDVHHYVQYILPGVIQAQRLLRSRMCEEAVTNVLVEGPVARFLMENHGDNWVAEARDIIASPTGKRNRLSGWKFKLSQGVLRGDITLSDKAKWLRGELCVDAAVPDTIVNILPGKLLSEVVSHHFFGPEIKIVAARTDMRREWSTGVMVQTEMLVLRTSMPDLRLSDFEEPLAEAA